MVGGGVGLLAGYYGRWVNELLMRFVNMVLAIPAIFIHPDVHPLPPQRAVAVGDHRLGGLGGGGAAGSRRSAEREEPRLRACNQVDRSRWTSAWRCCVTCYRTFFP